MIGKIKSSYLFVGLLLFFGCNPKDSGIKNPEHFQNPPAASMVHAWWHWVDGNITEEGITKDLEAMHEKGISQVTILNIGFYPDRNYGGKRITFNSPEWYRMFKFALEEANRLDIMVGVHNCDGWATSGGPWVTPEHAMKKITWNKTIVTGGQQLKMKLKTPYSINDYYKDVTILALPSEYPNSKFRTSLPKISLNNKTQVLGLFDGNPASGIKMSVGDELLIKLNKPIEVNKVSIYSGKDFIFRIPDEEYSGYFSLWKSEDGKQWKKVDEFTTNGINATSQRKVKSSKACYFKIKLEQEKNFWHNIIGELELLNDNEQPLFAPLIEHHQAKISASMGISASDFFPTNTKKINANQVQPIDLTQKVNSQGELEWDAPPGNWKIIRFGYTLTGATNHPATTEGTGFEVDKMDTSALNIHYNNFTKKLVNWSGDNLGSTFKYMLIDSWECRFQNWTATFPEAFENISGYSINDWLPVLAGEVVDNLHYSEAFLNDFRRTIAQLIQNNYYKHYADLCHADGLEMHAEVIYGPESYPPLDIMKANSYADMPMFEFWAGEKNEPFMKYNTVRSPEINFPANAALFYDKKICGAEAYTGFAHYSASPGEMKKFGDRAFCSGINQMIMHSYVHQPDERKPGMTLKHWGQTFNRHNTYWPHISDWIKYQSRLQYVLQNGRQVSDILFYVGDQLPQGLHNTDVPGGFNRNICNYDILSRMHVSNGNIISDNGLSFKILVLPNHKRINYSTLLVLEDLLNKGAVIIGAKPTIPLSLKDVKENGKQFAHLLDDLWNKNRKNGNSIKDISVGEAIQSIKLMPDFEFNSSDTSAFLCFHTKNTDDDFYFAVNQLDQTVTAECKFRVTGKFPELWNPVDGKKYAITNYKEENGLTYFTYQFKPNEAVLLVFNREEGSGIQKINGKIAKEYLVNNFSGTVSFQPTYNLNINDIEISSLEPLTSSEKDEIIYFSGQAEYKIKFKLPEDLYSGKSPYTLNLGKIESAGTVYLNGHLLGNAWHSYQDFDVSGLLKEINLLEVKVGVLYRNRFIGDLIEHGKPTSLWSSVEITKFLNKNSPLKESGLTGPIVIKEYQISTCK